MALSPSIVGRHYRHPGSYRVEREKVREYARAVQNNDPSFFDDEAAAELGYGARGAGGDFSHHGADQRQAARDPQAAEDVGQRRRQFQVPQRLQP